MSPLAVTALTDFILACESFFLAGKMAGISGERFSARWFWSGMLVLLGLSALLGGIDHGFFEPAKLPRYGIQRADWIVLGATTLCLLMATSRQFFPARWQRTVLMIGVAQLAVNTAAVLLIDSFLDVILNYAPVMVLLLVMSCAGLKDGRGSWPMVAGIVTVFAASAIQAMHVDVFGPLDANGLYHVVSMLGVALLYVGGTRFASARPTAAFGASGSGR